MASLEYTLTVGNGASGVMTPGQPMGATLVLFNPSGSNITIQGSPVPFATSNGNPYSGVIFGQLTATGNNIGGGAGAAAAPVVPAGGSLVFSFGLVLTGPQGSAETGSAQGNCANQPFVVGVNVVTTDGNSIAPTVTLTPSQAGAVTPSAAPTGPGQFLFSNPANSPNWQLV